jgi:hypothetical protein
MNVTIQISQEEIKEAVEQWLESRTGHRGTVLYFSQRISTETSFVATASVDSSVLDKATEKLFEAPGPRPTGARGPGVGTTAAEIESGAAADVLGGSGGVVGRASALGEEEPTDSPVVGEDLLDLKRRLSRRSGAGRRKR